MGLTALKNRFLEALGVTQQPPEVKKAALLESFEFHKEKVAEAIIFLNGIKADPSDIKKVEDLLIRAVGEAGPDTIEGYETAVASLKTYKPLVTTAETN